MKLKILAVMAYFTMLPLASCKAEIKPHKSYKACVNYIVNELDLEEFSYTVKEIKHDKYEDGNDKIHYFDITITSNNKTYRYSCFTKIDGDTKELIYIDCDPWETN